MRRTLRRLGCAYNYFMRYLLPLLLTLLFANSACAHPVPKSTHDRIIRIHLIPTDDPRRLKVSIDYRMEIDETTVVLEDMGPFRDEVDAAQFKGKALEYYAEFANIYAPIIAANLIVKLNDIPLVFRCAKKEPALVDEKRQPLGSLRCDFVFESEGMVQPDEKNNITFREGNYPLQDNKVDADIAADSKVAIFKLEAASAELKKRPTSELGPGDYDRLREVRATFALKQPDPAAKSSLPTPVANSPIGKSDADHDLMNLLKDSSAGIWLLLFFAAVAVAGGIRGLAKSSNRA